MLTTHEVTADYVVTQADARSEKDAAPKWYVLPEGWTWARVAAQRMVWGQPPEHYPIATVFGVAKPDARIFHAGAQAAVSAPRMAKVTSNSTHVKP